MISHVPLPPCARVTISLPPSLLPLVQTHPHSPLSVFPGPRLLAQSEADGASYKGALTGLKRNSLRESRSKDPPQLLSACCWWICCPLTLQVFLPPHPPWSSGDGLLGLVPFFFFPILLG